MKTHDDDQKQIGVVIIANVIASNRNVFNCKGLEMANDVDSISLLVDRF